MVSGPDVTPWRLVGALCPQSSCFTPDPRPQQQQIHVEFSVHLVRRPNRTYDLIRKYSEIAGLFLWRHPEESEERLRKNVQKEGGSRIIGATKVLG